jgi:hypothetical protein
MNGEIIDGKWLEIAINECFGRSPLVAGVKLKLGIYLTFFVLIGLKMNLKDK